MIMWMVFLVMNKMLLRILQERNVITDTLLSRYKSLNRIFSYYLLFPPSFVCVFFKVSLDSKRWFVCFLRLFKECPHPDEKQRLELSRRLSLETRQVKFWFQNRRTQMKVQTFSIKSFSHVFFEVFMKDHESLFLKSFFWWLFVRHNWRGMRTHYLDKRMIS